MASARTSQEIIDDAKARWPGRLYKYRPPIKERISDVLIQNRMHFSQPSEFNDPSDCELRIVKEEDDIFLKQFRRFAADNDPDLSDDEIDRQFHETEWDDLLHEHEKQLDDVYVHSLSEYGNLFNMWANYAGEHSGVCFEYSAKLRDNIFRDAFPVVYGSPVLFPFPSTNKDDLTYELILRKSQRWQSEKEWRILIPAEGSKDREFEPEILTGLIFGSRATAGFIDQVLEMVAQRPQPLKLYRAVGKEREYGLDIVPFEP